MEGRRISDILLRESQTYGHNITAVFINPGNPLGQLKSLASDKELVVVAGGDGTVSCIAACLSTLEAPPPFAVLPLGTGNDLARSTGWFNIWKDGGLDGFLNAIRLSKTESLDIWGFDNGPRFTCYAGVGLDAGIISFIDRHRSAIPAPGAFPSLRRVMLRIMYIAAAARCTAGNLLGSSPQRGEIAFSLKKTSVKRIKCARNEVVVMASVDSYGGGGRLWTGTRRDDGKFEVYIFPTLISFLKFMIQSHIGGKFRPKPSFQADSARFIKAEGSPVQMDGEACSIPEGNEPRIALQRVIPILIPPDDLAARDRVRRPQEEGKEINAEVSTAVPGAASAGRTTARRANRSKDRGNDISGRI